MWAGPPPMRRVEHEVGGSSGGCFGDFFPLGSGCLRCCPAGSRAGGSVVVPAQHLRSRRWLRRRGSDRCCGGSGTGGRGGRRAGLRTRPAGRNPGGGDRRQRAQAPGSPRGHPGCGHGPRCRGLGCLEHPETRPDRGIGPQSQCATRALGQYRALQHPRSGYGKPRHPIRSRRRPLPRWGLLSAGAWIPPQRGGCAADRSPARPPGDAVRQEQRPLGARST